MTPEQFKNEMLGQFKPTIKDELLYKLAAKYHEECEKFDQSVCSRGDKEIAIPANWYEMKQINKNSIQVRKHISVLAYAAGISTEELTKAIQRYVRKRRAKK